MDPSTPFEIRRRTVFVEHCRRSATSSTVRSRLSCLLVCICGIFVFRSVLEVFPCRMPCQNTHKIVQQLVAAAIINVAGWTDGERDDMDPDWPKRIQREKNDICRKFRTLEISLPGNRGDWHQSIGFFRS